MKSRIQWPFQRRLADDVREMLTRLQVRGKGGTRPYDLTKEEKARMKRQVYERLGLGEP